MPKISVIIPVYNSAPYLKRCLDSVCNQTLSDIEIICINDGSTDNSLEILKNYGVKVIDLKENKGVSYARNVGIEFATGEYLGFVDADDFVELDFYEKLYTLAENSDIVKGNILDADTRTITTFYDMNNKIKENKAYFYYGFTSAIYKTSFIWDYNIDFPVGINYFEDPFFSIKSIINSYNIKIVDDAFYFYSQNLNSLSKNVEISSLQNSIALIMKELNESCLNEIDYQIICDFIFEFILDKKDKQILINFIDKCKFKSLKIYYLNKTIEILPNELKAKFLSKRREFLYA